MGMLTLSLTLKLDFNGKTGRLLLTVSVGLGVILFGDLTISLLTCLQDSLASRRISGRCPRRFVAIVWSWARSCASKLLSSGRTSNAWLRACARVSGNV